MYKFGAKFLGPSINAQSISLIVPRKTDLKRTPIKFFGNLRAYFIAKVAPHEPPTIKNFFILKSQGVIARRFKQNNCARRTDKRDGGNSDVD